MADKPQVVKLAQPGIDVKTAGDDKLVYNSNWPLLKIVKSGSVEITDFNHPTLLTNHDLGYPGFFWFFSNETIGGWLNPTVHVSETRSEYNGPSDTFSPAVSNNQLLFATNGTGLSDSGTLRLYYYLFALDLSKQYNAPTIKSGGVVGPRNTQTVFKLAKEGKDISSNNLNDYVVHSAARSPMVHSVNPGKATTDSSSSAGNSFTVNHNLGYAPMIFGFYKQVAALKLLADAPTDSYTILPVAGSGGSLFFEIDEQKVKFHTATAGMEISLVILKDPFNIDNITPVSV